jgi:Maf1 regulator
MKYIHDIALAELTALLSDCPVWSSATGTDGTNAANSRTLHGRLEAYTTKRAGMDKKYAVNVSGRYTAEQEAEEQLSSLLLLQQRPEDTYVGRGRKRRSASTGEAPSEIQKARTTSMMPAGRCRANSLDIPRWNPPVVTEETVRTSPTKPNFRALSLASVNRRLLTDLILTLNHSFPDYDFCNAGIVDFTVCSLQTAVTRINERLGEFSAATAASAAVNGASANGPLSNGSSFLSTLWKAVDNVITLSQVSEVYSYQPVNSESSDDPFSFLKSSLVKGSLDDYECNVVSGSNSRSAMLDSYGRVNDDDDSEYDDMDESYSKSRRRPGSFSVHREVLWTFNYFFVNKHAKRILLFTCIETMTRSGCFYETPALVPFVSTSHKNTSSSSVGFDAIPEDEAVHHQLYDGTGATDGSNVSISGTPGSALQRRRRQYKYLRPSSSLHPSDDDIVSGNDDEEEDEEEEDDSHTIESSSAVSVDFDLDPANAVSGGIPIGN